MKKYLFAIIILILIVLGFLLFPITFLNTSQQKNPIEKKDTIIILPPTIDEIIENGIPNDTSKIENGIIYETEEYTIIEDRVKTGDAMGNILSKYNISHTDIYKLEQASKEIFNLDNIKEGEDYTVICSKDSNESVQCFVYKKSKTEYIVCDFRDSISVYKGTREVDTINNTISGTIKQGESISFSLTKLLGNEKGDPLVDILANKIYAWSIDPFQIQAKDSFIVHYEELYVRNKFHRIGQIHAASFTHKGKVINAFKFKENEHYADYFDEDGNNLRSAFLKSPIDIARVSSGFGHRKHPISGKWKKHKGTDYAAKTGTPIRVTANGTITYANRKGGYGNCVIVKHNDKFTTLYAHLSKFKSGAGRGSYVKQGDIIGYVGSTGYATGPHLHYEFMLYGKQVDHIKQDLPPSKPLKEENKEAFEKVRDEYLKILENFVK